MELVVTYAPREKQKRVRVVTFKIDVDTLRLIDEAAENLGLNRSELIRRAVIEFIKNPRVRGCGEE